MEVYKEKRMKNADAWFFKNFGERGMAVNFIMPLRGLDIPAEILSELEREDNFKTFDEKKYFYHTATLNTEEHNQIEALFSQILDIAEPYSDLFKSISKQGGPVELYIFS